LVVGDAVVLDGQAGISDAFLGCATDVAECIGGDAGDVGEPLADLF
jgi:hypothetical protein